jgi:hypothetical protein
MNQSLVADLLVAIHFGWVIFIVFGLLVIIVGGILRWRFIRNFWFRTIHLAMILIVVFEEIFRIPCPLTIWEYELRTTSGQLYVTDMPFIPRLIHKLIFFDFPPIVFTVAYFLFGLAVLLSWPLVPPVLPWKREKEPKSGEQ